MFPIWSICPELDLAKATRVGMTLCMGATVGGATVSKTELDAEIYLNPKGWWARLCRL